MWNIDNATLHVYPDSPFICKACVNLREGGRIRLQLPLRDEDTAAVWLFEHYPDTPIKTIRHHC